MIQASPQNGFMSSTITSIGYDEMWLDESSIEDHFESEIAPPPAVSQKGSFDELLNVADSLDMEESPRPGVYFNDVGNPETLREQHAAMLSWYKLEAPETPASTKPTFNELPSIISPESNLNRDPLSPSPIDQAFLPPREDLHFPNTPPNGLHQDPCMDLPGFRQRPSHYFHYSSVSSSHFDQTQLKKLAESMRRSQMSRQAILVRLRGYYGNHPSVHRFQKMEHAQRQVWAMVTSQQQQHRSGN